jgi:hypothetical protein
MEGSRHDSDINLNCSFKAVQPGHPLRYSSLPIKNKLCKHIRLYHVLHIPHIGANTSQKPLSHNPITWTVSYKASHNAPDFIAGIILNYAGHHRYELAKRTSGLHSTAISTPSHGEGKS